MKKIYFLLLFVACFAFSSTELKAQSSFNSSDKQSDEVLIYPNPVVGNTLNVSTKSGKSITCRVFNVLGKIVMFKVITANELDISSLATGIYILKFKIGDNEEFTQKLFRQ